MPDEVDISVLEELDVAIRRMVAELERSAYRLRIALERAREQWRGGRCRAFDGEAHRLEVDVLRMTRELRSLHTLWGAR